MMHHEEGSIKACHHESMADVGCVRSNILCNITSHICHAFFSKNAMRLFFQRKQMQSEEASVRCKRISNVRKTKVDTKMCLLWLHSLITQFILYLDSPYILYSLASYICEACIVHMRIKCMENLTGWRRLIGSPKLQIIFYKRATKYRSLLTKMTYKDKGSYESSPPCTQWKENKM